MAVSLKQTYDIDLIASIMALPEVLEKASNQVDVSYIPEVSENSGWFLGYHKGALIGIIHAKHVNPNAIEIHPYSLNIKTSRELIKEFYRVFIDLPDQVNKIICLIPESFKKTINFARRLGFIDEGYLKESYNSDNKFIGVYILGITREEIEVYLDGCS